MMKVLCTRVANCESGATAMEYAVTAAILSVVLLTGADTLANAVNDTFLSMSTKLEIASQDAGDMPGGTRLISLQSGSAAQAFGSVQHASGPP
ncbi:MAG: Flp family type IVb pilin [Hoeflea sp.]|uniref:Flp family type IVb pilin n=1 Tax=Hoeflea sp. TaxID=1940281 RepID=UPI003EF50DE1